MCNLWINHICQAAIMGIITEIILLIVSDNPMINILTDSTADIPKELCETYQIETIPVNIQLNGKGYKDGLDIHPDMLFDAVRATGQYPTTSAPSPNDFAKFFNRETPSIYIGLSSRM